MPIEVCRRSGCRRPRSIRRSRWRARAAGRASARRSSSSRCMRRPERLDHRVVDARGDACPSSRAGPACAQAVAEDPGRVLAAAVASAGSLPAGVGGASGPSAGRRRRARCAGGRRSTSPRPGGRRRRGPRRSRPCPRAVRVLGDVGEPQPVRARRRRTGAAPGRHARPAPAGAAPLAPVQTPARPSSAHQPGDPLATAAAAAARAAARRAPAARRRCRGTSAWISMIWSTR